MEGLESTLRPRRTHGPAQPGHRLDLGGDPAAHRDDRERPDGRRDGEGAGPAMTASDGSGPADPDAIRADIERTREQLSRTVDELSRRLDVPSRAKERVYRARDTAVETYRESPPVVLGAAAALVALVVGLVIWRRKR